VASQSGDDGGAVTVAPTRQVDAEPVERGEPFVLLDGPARRSLVWETRFVLLAFLLSGVTSAVVLFAQHLNHSGDTNRFPEIVHHEPVVNMLLGIFSYLAVGGMVPLVLLLLIRTGQPPSWLGLGRKGSTKDLLPALGLVAVSIASEYLFAVLLSPLMTAHKAWFATVPTGHVPAYYLIWGLVISAVTAVTEEVIVNGYLLTRLDQFGWTAPKALLLSLVLRTSYHAYYGVGLLLTIPFGYFVTRSFQKHRRLNRSVLAHFLFDGILMTLAILT
jgi:membrane protease YdiL (CAAX protease family)